MRTNAGRTPRSIYQLSEIEKQPCQFGRHVEFRPVLYGLGPDHSAAFYKLRYYNDQQGQALPAANGKVQLEGSYEQESFRDQA